jgi:hypothetical protein
VASASSLRGLAAVYRAHYASLDASGLMALFWGMCALAGEGGAAFSTSYRQLRLYLAQELLRKKGISRAQCEALALALARSREGDLRDRWRCVDDMSSFEQWISECAARIFDDAGPERAGIFLDRVSEVLGRPIATAA